MSPQWAIASKHRDRAIKLEEIIQALGVDAAEFAVVFVVPFEDLSIFKFPTNLGSAMMYVTTNRRCAKDAILNAIMKNENDPDE